MHDMPVFDRVVRHVSLRTPNLFTANVALLGLHYFARNRVFPRPLSSPRAGLMDYVFWKSVGPWSEFERACVDKEICKPIVRHMCPEIGIAEALEVFPLAGLSYDGFRKLLLAHRGEHAVAKPTHGSGTVLFLEDAVDERKLRKFYRECQANYFALFREGQYHELEKKVLVERSLGDPATGRKAPDDFKFFCSRGRAFLCQINVDRYGDHRLVNMSVPDFVDSGVEYGTRRPDRPVPMPARWADLVAYAERLSEPFEFVRLDLYEAHDGIYFGEFTFTPGAGLTNFSDRKFDRWLLRQLRREPIGRREGRKGRDFPKGASAYDTGRP